MNPTTLSDRDIDALLSGEARSTATDVRLLRAYLSDVRATFSPARPPTARPELATMLRDGLPALAEEAAAAKRKAPSSRESMRTWWRRTSMRVGVGAVGMLGFCAGMGAANALPAPAQLVVSHVAHAFSIDMPAPGRDKPGHVEPAPASTTEPEHAAQTPAPAGTDDPTAAPAATGPTAAGAASTSPDSAHTSSSSSERQSSGDRRRGSGTSGRNGGSSALTSQDSGATGSTAGESEPNDVRRADDTSTGAGATGEVEHQQTPGVAPTDVSGRAAGGAAASTSGGGSGSSTVSSGASATTDRAASVSGGGH